MFTPVFSLAGYIAAELTFTTNYQSFGDAFDVNLWSAGTLHTTLIGWSDPGLSSTHRADMKSLHTTLIGWSDPGLGSFRSSPGVDVQVSLDPFLELPDLQIAFRYYDTDGDPWDWYVQVDDVMVSATEPEVPEAVPEPATMLLFATGMAALMGSRIRRRNK